MDKLTDGQGDFSIPLPMFVFLGVNIQANVPQDLDSVFISLTLKLLHAMQDAYEDVATKFQHHLMIVATFFGVKKGVICYDMLLHKEGQC